MEYPNLLLTDYIVWWKKWTHFVTLTVIIVYLCLIACLKINLVVLIEVSFERFLSLLI